MKPPAQCILSCPYCFPPSPEVNTIVNLVFPISMHALYYVLYIYTHKQHIILFVFYAIMLFVVFHKLHAFIHATLWLLRFSRVDAHSPN